MARTSTPVKTSNREYDLNHWVEGLNDKTTSNTRRLYCAAQAVVRLCKDPTEQSTDVEDATFLVGIAGCISALATPAALAADAKAGKGVAMVAKRQNATAAIASRDAIIADLMARLAAAEAPATPPTAPKRGRKAGAV